MPKITKKSIKSYVDPTWCPGCGNFAILNALQSGLAEMELPEEDVVITYGVGCCSNMADFNRVYGIHGLHGRSIPPAVGVKLANHDLKVISVAGDGGTMGEGVNHLLAACRGNHDITIIIHNNRLYSLTTGQSSPTTPQGTATKSTPLGLIEKPYNIAQLTINSHATFVSRVSAGEPKHMKEVIKKAVKHTGVSIVEVLQPCVTFNKEMSYQWIKERVYDVSEKKHDASDKAKAFKAAEIGDKIAIGILYQDKKSKAYHEEMEQLEDKPLIEHWTSKRNISPLIEEYK